MPSVTKHARDKELMDAYLARDDGKDDWVFSIPELQAMFDNITASRIYQLTKRYGVSRRDYQAK